MTLTLTPDYRFHIRWWIRRDLPAIQRIEDASFHNPWDVEDFLRVSRQRNIIGMTVEGPDDKVVGYMVYELWRRKLNLLKMVVHPQYLRMGVGTTMIAKLASKMSSHRRHKIVTLVPESNLPALLFFRKCGFEATMVHRGYYGDAGDDGISMVWAFKKNRPEQYAWMEQGR